jgi:hypothetical protein
MVEERRARPGGFFLAGLTLLALAGCNLPGRGPASARLVFERLQQDLGDVNGGDGARTEFRLRNEGRGMLRIDRVDGNCGCLAPSYPSALAPGGNGEILVRFEPAANWSGPMERSLKVYSNDPAHPVQELKITARVIPLIAMEPPSPLPLPYRRGEVLHREIRLTPRPGTGVKILSATSLSPLIQARLRPPAAGQEIYRLDLTIGPCKGPGDFNADVRLPTTAVKQLPAATYVVNGQAQTGVVFDPLQVLIPMVRENSGGAELARVKVFTRSGRLQLLGAAVDHPNLRAEITPREAGRSYEVIVRIVTPLPRGSVSTAVRITSDDPNFPNVEVPLDAAVP